MPGSRRRANRTTRGPSRHFIPGTNSIESLNYQLRKIIRNRGYFPDDDAVIKLLWLAICTIPVVIGDFDAMRIGAQRAGLDPDTVRVITDPRAAENDPNVIEMVQTGQVLADIAVGQLSPVAGETAPTGSSSRPAGWRATAWSTASSQHN